MKKVILSAAALAFFATTIISCGENKEAEATSTETVATETPNGTEVTTTTETTVSTDAPKFSNEDVNKGLEEYKTLLADYITAVKSKDQGKISELTTKFTQWSQNAATWSSKLKAEEMQQFSDYMQKLSKDWTDAATAAVQ